MIAFEQVHNNNIELNMLTHSHLTPPSLKGPESFVVDNRAISSSLLQSPTFLRIGGGHNMEKMTDVERIFNEVLEPLYGPQTKAIFQIQESKDRNCFLLYEDQTFTNPVAVLCFKIDPTDEFAEFGVKKSVEIKSLFVYHPKDNSGKGYASRLVDKLKNELHGMLTAGYAQSIHVTVSEKVPESLVFFSKKKDFEVVHTWNGRYHQGVKEHLLVFKPRSSGVVVNQCMTIAEPVSPVRMP